MTAMLARQQFDDGGSFAMPPHAQHDAFVGPFHGGSLQEFGACREGKAQRAHHRSTNCVAWGGGHGAKSAFAHPTQVYALNQPTASPVKEKYNPAAVSAQEITSMPLSNCTPLSPITCTSEITD